MYPSVKTSSLSMFLWNTSNQMHDPNRVVRSRVVDGQYFPIVVRTNKIAEEEQTRFSYFVLVQCFLWNF